MGPHKRRLEAASLDASEKSARPAASRRIIAIGDLHGAIDSLVDLARLLGIADGKLDLDLPDSDLVFLGDLCDRGQDSRSLYELVMRWQLAAPAMGSMVWFVLGNHEVMNCYGMHHYNTTDEFLSFDRSSLAAGRKAHDAAFAPGGWLRDWLSRQHAIVKVGGFVFAHADLPARLAESAVAEIEDRTLGAFHAARGEAGPLPAELFDGAESVLWCREAQIDRRADYGLRLGRFLARNQASAYVCGHTPSEEGRFRQLFAGRYLCIDTAMTFERVHGVGRKSALIIERGAASAAYAIGTGLEFVPLDLRFCP